MTTSRTRALVSLATMIVTVALGACASAGAAPRRAAGGWAPAEAHPRAIRFDNDGRDHVHVYLVGERREWLLGRLEPGATAILRIPAAALTEHPGWGFVRLAVVAGGRVTLRAARDARVQFSVAQPLSAILSQEWRLTQGQLTSLTASRPGAGQL
jgi:hypothetical protein